MSAAVFCVGLDLSIVLLSARDAWGLWHHRHFPNQSQSCGKIHLSTSLQRTLKNKVYDSLFRGYPAGLGPYNQVKGEERRRVCGSRVLLLLGSRVGCLGFLGFTLLIDEIKTQEGELQRGRGKAGLLTWSVIEVIQGFLKGKINGWCDLALYLVV